MIEIIVTLILLFAIIYRGCHTEKNNMIYQHGVRYIFHMLILGKGQEILG